jgi:hypothetical protein
MDKQDLYLQVFGVVWVAGGSLLAITKADWFVRVNKRMARNTDANSIRLFFGFTLVLGILGAINIAIQVFTGKGP